MNKDEASACLKEILTLTKHMPPTSVSFEASSEDEVSEGYKLHIKGATHAYDKEIIKQVAKWHGLATKDENNELTIYEPKTTNTKP